MIHDLTRSYFNKYLLLVEIILNYFISITNYHYKKNNNIKSKENISAKEVSTATKLCKTEKPSLLVSQYLI